MAKYKICVIHSDSKIESLYTLFPLIVSKYSSLIKFLCAGSQAAKNAEGDCVILVRVFKGNKSFGDDIQRKRSYINDFRKRFKRVIMLDDGAGSDSLHHEYMDLVDLYYKGKLLLDKKNYLKPMYGRQIFTDYYHKKYDVTDEAEKLRVPPSDPLILAKLRVSWNLGCGIYPMPNANFTRLVKWMTRVSLSKVLKPWFIYRYKQMLKELERPIDYSQRKNFVHARFSYNSFPNTIGYQRKILVNKCLEHKNAITGKIQPKAYNREIQSVAAVLSPFGWGEVCFRDFEAIINGCLLIKPSMEHIETWPNIYQSNKTYLPIDWDGEDVVDVMNYVSNHPSRYKDIIEKGRAEYQDALLKLDDKIKDFLEESLGETVE